MKRFAFALEPALRLREREETEAQRAVADALRRLEAQQAALEALREERESVFAGIGDSQSAESAFRLLLRQWLAAWEGRWESESGRLEGLRQGLREAEAALLEKARARKALEGLKEKRRLEHRKQTLRVEQKEGDEAAARFHRRVQAELLAARGRADQATEPLT